MLCLSSTDLFAEEKVNPETLVGNLVNYSKRYKKYLRCIVSLNIPEVCPIAEVPGGRVTDYITAVSRFLEHRVRPKCLWHRFEADRSEKLLSHDVHVSHVVFLPLKIT